MGINGIPGLLVCAANGNAQDDLRSALQKGGHQAAVHLLGGPDPDRLESLHLVVVDGDGAAAEALDLCRRLRRRLDESVVPILYVTDDPGPAARLAAFEAGADTCLLRPFDP